MDEHDEHHEDDPIADRLRALGREPVESALASRHLTAIGSLPPRRRFGRASVAAAAIVGFVVGSLGLGFAGALPGPAQNVANDVFQTVGVDGPWKNRGECVSEAARANPTDEAAKQAAKDNCPKGGAAKSEGRERGRGAGGAVGKPDKPAKSSDPCKGPPPWAGRPGTVSDADKAAFEQRRAACPAAPAGAGEPKTFGQPTATPTAGV